MIRFLRSPKGLLTVVFLPLLLIAGTAAGWSVALPHVAAGIAGACLAELMIVRLDTGSWRWPSSALLSGTIVAMVLGTETAGAITATVGALATISKHLISVRERHLFNPAGVALLAAIPLYAAGESWWGALPEVPWPWIAVLIAGGIFIVDRINKFPLALSFLGLYFSAFTVAALIAPDRVAEMFREPFVHAALFLAFFMVTDPPTSPTRERDQLAAGAVTAVTCVVSQLAGAGQAFLLIGLLAGNAMFDGMALLRRRRL